MWQCQWGHPVGKFVTESILGSVVPLAMFDLKMPARQIRAFCFVLFLRRKITSRLAAVSDPNASCRVEESSCLRAAEEDSGLWKATIQYYGDLILQKKRLHTAVCFNSSVSV